MAGSFEVTPLTSRDLLPPNGSLTGLKPLRPPEEVKATILRLRTQAAELLLKADTLEQYDAERMRLEREMCDQQNSRTPTEKSQMAFQLYGGEPIVVAVAKSCNVTTQDVFSQDRRQRFVMARALAAYLLRGTGLSYPTIGRMLARDHTTIVYTCRKIEQRMGQSKVFADMVNKLRAATRTQPENEVIS